MGPIVTIITIEQDKSALRGGAPSIFSHSPIVLSDIERAKINTTGVPAKPVGTDDGFKGAGAACGSSIVKMAQAMVSTRPFTRGFTVAK